LQFESRVEANTGKILDALASHHILSTFFVLGWVAERHKEFIRRIADHGHEIASHGYEHRNILAQSPAQFREEIRKTKRILEDITGQAVLGYRAPSFSITAETKWALQILVEEGYTYDSSIFPIYHDQYGLPGANPFVHILSTDSGNIWEIPPSTVKVLGFRVPIAGGGYFRLFPYWILRRLSKKAELAGHPLILYLHPWELDPNQPRMNGPLFSKFRHYVNLHKTQDKLLLLLREYRFAPIREVFPDLIAIDHGTQQPLVG